MKPTTRDIWFLIITIGAFLVWKLSSLHFRFGDENVYFYMTQAIRSGLLPYRDFNLADPPAFIYLFTGFSAFIGKHYIFFKVWPPLFDVGNAILIFLILKQYRNAFAALGPMFYLFSFTVLSTSDYVTGAETAIFLMLLAIYLERRGRSAWSGAAWALACLCKLYIAPALLAYLGYMTYKREYRQLARVIVAGSLVGVMTLLPFVLAAPRETLLNLVAYQLHRPAGLNKWAVFRLFLEMEWPLVLAGGAGLWLSSPKRLVWPLIASLIFLISFKDLYYLYLHILIPFLVLLSVATVARLAEQEKEFAWGFIILYTCAALYPTLSYIESYAPQGIFHNPAEIADALRNAPGEAPVYGVQEAAPLLALMSGRPIFDNIIDTNTQNFLSGALERNAVSAAATQRGVYLVARVADYPDQQIIDTGFEPYFEPAVFQASCATYKRFPRPVPEDPLNDVAIYRCGF